MTPYKASFYIYAESAEQVKDLERALHDFVAIQYQEGIIVTAKHLTRLLNTYGHSPLTRHILG